MKQMISIIVPVYNVEAYVGRCIESVLAQTYADWELILVDDGSTDRSGQICEEYAKKDSRIYVRHTENGGVSKARNLGIDLAKGNYLLFADSDDYIMQELLEKARNAFETTGADVFSFNVYNVVSGRDGDKTVPADKWEGRGDRKINGEEIFRVILNKSATLWNKIFSADIIAKVRFDETMSFGEDTDFLIRALFQTESCWISSYYGYCYCMNREGNVVSAPIGKRDAELLDNAVKNYDALSVLDDNTIAAHRINVVVNQVMSKLAEQKHDPKTDRAFIAHCHKTSRYPGMRNTWSYMKDSRYRVGYRLRFIIAQLSPRAFLFYKRCRARNRTSV